MINAFHLRLNCTSTNNNRLKNEKGSKNYEEFHFSNLYPMQKFFTNELHKYLQALIWQNVAGTSVSIMPPHPYGKLKRRTHLLHCRLWEIQG